MARTATTVEAIAARIRPICEADSRIEAAFLFGSTARKVAGPTSDIDLAVLLWNADSLPLLYSAELLTACMEALGRNDVDLVILNTAPAFLKYRILRDGVCFYDLDPPGRVSFQARAYSEYFDLKPFLERVYGLGSRTH